MKNDRSIDAGWDRIQRKYNNNVNRYEADHIDQKEMEINLTRFSTEITN